MLMITLAPLDGTLGGVPGGGMPGGAGNSGGGGVLGGGGNPGGAGGCGGGLIEAGPNDPVSSSASTVMAAAASAATKRQQNQKRRRSLRCFRSASVFTAAPPSGIGFKSLSGTLFGATDFCGTAADAADPPQLMVVHGCCCITAYACWTCVGKVGTCPCAPWPKCSRIPWSNTVSSLLRPGAPPLVSFGRGRSDIALVPIHAQWRFY